MLFGVFMPFQVVLLPMSQVLGWLGISSSVGGPDALFMCLAGMAEHHAVFPQLLRRPFPQELVNAAMHRRRGLLAASSFASCVPLSTPIMPW